MLDVTNTFTAEAKERVRRPVGKALVSWKKGFQSDITFFTIGVSRIGGNDVIKGEGDVVQEWSKYQYFDESDNLMSLDWERSLKLPIGGITSALASGRFDNSTGRYTPHYLGGDSELFTSVLPRRPVILNAGFDYNGVDNTVPQFVGVFDTTPEISKRSSTMDFKATDFTDFLRNRFVDQTSMFTGQRTDQVMDTILQNLGYSTAQYELDLGYNNIGFGIFERGTKWINIIDELAQAEFGHFYQDEQGILRFENRQHWATSPHNEVSTVLFTSDVLDSRTPSEDHLINVVEVKSKPRAKQPKQMVFKLAAPIEIFSDTEKELFVDFDDPMLEVDDPTIVGNTLEDGSGSSITISLKSSDVFARAAKFTFRNNSGSNGFITDLTIYGRPAKIQKDIYERRSDDSSVTAYEERVYRIENNYIQSESWAESLSQLVLEDFGEVENLQEITIRARPELQLGDLISWQGRSWRVFAIRTLLDADNGFVQDIKLLQRDVKSYFTIGVSRIGGEDGIAP